MSTWRKSSYSFSNGNCAEVAAWRRSARCNGGACVEVGQGTGRGRGPGHAGPRRPGADVRCRGVGTLHRLTQGGLNRPPAPDWPVG